ncbi:serine carboxypeptidase-like 3 isoform X2 [Miscanthus floridulus]|uniref:serine carboxypeptidase-like 3 isoform X2 n=1 Tax=Miscanthus floridulus TaxID=154761 RepID=UPI0034582A96
MANNAPTCHAFSWLWLLLLLGLWCLVLYCPMMSSALVVRELPGFDGPLPFFLETGYVEVDESNGVQLFYYFVQSERDPARDPLLLWLQGGPGCSGLSGLVYEIGPFLFDVQYKVNGYEGGIPRLLYRPQTWTKVSNIIFVDSPVGAGFSYASTEEGFKSSDTIAIKQLVIFLKKWLDQHPQFMSNPLYIGGESYCGIIIPALTLEIDKLIRKASGESLHFNLKGYIAGNPMTDKKFDTDGKIKFFHGMGLISDELYELAKVNCRGSYDPPANHQCAKCIESINHHDSYELLYIWTNDESVRKNLGIRQETVGEWRRCNISILYEKDIPSTVEHHRMLRRSGYQALIYSGDHDSAFSFVGTQAWIRSLNLSINEDWRPWHVDDQVAGFTTGYSSNLTYATVKGAGHTAPEYKPKECLTMFARWISSIPL